MRLFPTTSDAPTDCNSSAKSAFIQIPDRKGPTPRPLLGFARKHHSDDAPLPPVVLKGISTTGIETDLTSRFSRRRGILENVRKRFSQIVRLTLSRHCPTAGLEVFVEVRRETVYDPERNMAPTRETLGT